MTRFDPIGSRQTNLEIAMKAVKLLHEKLSMACPEVHEIRLKALITSVTSASTDASGNGHRFG